MKHVAVIFAGSIPMVAACAAIQARLSAHMTLDAEPPTPTRPVESIAEQWQPGDTTGVLIPQWQPGDATNLLAPQWQPGDTTGVLVPQWTPPTFERAATSTSLADVEATTSTVTAGVSVPQDPAVQAAVAGQVGVTEAAYDEALRNPDDPTLIAAVEAATVEGSPARSEFVGAYEAIVSAGRWAVPDPAVPNSVTIIGDPYIAPGAREAVATVCHVSGDSLMGRDANEDEVVLADTRNARLIVQTFRLVDSTWRLFQREQLLLIPEGTSCDTSTGSSPSSSESSPP